MRRPQSLRGRLILTLTSLLVAVGLVIGVVTTYALRHELTGQVDRQLRESVQRAQRAEFGGPGGPRQRQEDAAACPTGTRPAFVGPGQVDGTLGARFSGGALVDAQSGVIDTSTTGAQDCAVALTGAQAEALRGVGLGEPATVELPGLGTYRVVAATLPTGDAVQVTGVPLAGVETTLLGVLGVEAAVILLGVAAAAATGTVLVRRDLEPLRRVAATATRVSELELDRGEVDLEHRVPARDTDERTEVGRVGSALNRLLDHVGSALSARHASEQRVRQFVADASHELRTPLAAIRGYAELPRRRGADAAPVPADVAHALRRVESEAVRMTGLVEDLLLLARLDSGRPLERERVDLTMTVLDAVSDARVAGPEHTWRLELPEEAVEVTGDAARLHQVLVNLLANARSHTPPGTTVTVRLERDGGDGGDGDGDVRDGGRVHLDVVDDGPGIAADLLPHVFERFARGDSSRARGAGSTGLGLAIVQAVVASHHGGVEVRSRPGRTAFRVSLPAAAAGGPSPA